MLCLGCEREVEGTFDDLFVHILKLHPEVVKELAKETNVGMLFKHRCIDAVMEPRRMMLTV